MTRSLNWKNWKRRGGGATCLTRYIALLPGSFLFCLFVCLCELEEEQLAWSHPLLFLKVQRWLWWWQLQNLVTMNKITRLHHGDDDYIIWSRWWPGSTRTTIRCLTLFSFWSRDSLTKESLSMSEESGDHENLTLILMINHFFIILIQTRSAVANAWAGSPIKTWPSC